MYEWYSDCVLSAGQHNAAEEIAGIQQFVGFLYVLQRESGPYVGFDFPLLQQGEHLLFLPEQEFRFVIEEVEGEGTDGVSKKNI